MGEINKALVAEALGYFHDAGDDGDRMYVGAIREALQSEKARADAAEARVAALEAGMRGLVEAVVEHTGHLARDSTCGLCAALHSAYALLNRPADVEADRNG